MSLIAWMDHFIDTKEKRYALFCILTLTLASFLVIPYLFLAITMMRIHVYEDLFALLHDSWILPYTFVSRFIVSSLGYATLDGKTLLMIFLRSISMFEVVVLAFWMVLLSRDEMKWIKRICLVLMIGMIPLVIAAFVCGYQALSLYEVIAVLHVIAMGMGVMSIILLISIFIMLVGCYIPKYWKAMQYQAVEITENT